MSERNEHLRMRLQDLKSKLIETQGIDARNYSNLLKKKPEYADAIAEMMDITSRIIGVIDGELERVRVMDILESVWEGKA